jgi:hypothetical protein
MEHTPGPWELDSAKDTDGRYHIINGQVPKGINADFGYPVADTMNRHHCISPEEDQGNGQLLAAAPMLYKALKQIEERMERWEKFGIQSGMKGKDADFYDLKLYASYAIAKAEGR